MKSTKVMLGFLLAALAVSFVGCKHAMTQEEYIKAQKDFGHKTLNESKAEKEKSLKNQTWQSFYSSFRYQFQFNLKTQDVSKADIEKAVKAFNKRNDDDAKSTGKFNPSRPYGRVIYIGNGEKMNDYSSKEDQAVQDAFSHKFDITVIGDLNNYNPY